MKTIIKKIIVLAALSSYALATSYSWDKNVGKVYVFFNNESVRNSLNKFCIRNSCVLKIDEEGDYLNAKNNGTFNFNSNSDLLNYLSNKNNFSWYYYNKTLHIASNSFKMEVLSVPPDYLINLKQNLSDVGLLNNKFGWTENPDSSTVIVSGPVRYISTVKEFVQNFTPTAKGNNFAVIKLKYANAADQTLNFAGVSPNGGSFIIPGVATIINNLTNPYIMQEYQSSFSNNPQSTTLLKNVVDSYKNDPNINYVLSQSINKDNNNKDSKSGNNDQHVMSTFPIVQPDIRNNAIVIFDKNANIPMYQKLIELLDVAQPMIQVNTTIIDVDEDKLDTEGINWIAGIMGAAVGFNGANVKPTTGSLSVATTTPNQMLVSGGQVSGVIANINFLSQKGIAQIQSTPSVVTLMEMPAVTTFSTDIALSQQATTTGSANAAQVTAGSSIAITPHQIGNNTIRLEISLNSTQLYDQANVSTVPITSGGRIQTQAVVRPGDGLLLGGYTQTRKVQFNSQVPYLGSIPLLGLLFRDSVIKSIHFKRVYLITVNMIDSDKKIAPKNPLDYDPLGALIESLEAENNTKT